MGRATGVLTTLLIFSTVGLGQLLAGQIYWTDRGYNDPNGPSIRRGEMDGSGSEILLDATDGLSQLRGIGLDAAGGKMYFADNGTDNIYRADLNGDNLETLLTNQTTPITFPADIELDLGARKMYWTDPTLNKISRADFDGNNVEILYSGLNNPYFFDLDTANGEIYWAEMNNEVIHVSKMDGSGHIRSLNVGLHLIRDVAVDLVADKIYWGERASNTIRSANLDGTDATTLFNAADKPHGVEIDVAGGMVYWNDTDGRSVNRGRMDGIGPLEILYYNPLYNPWDLELVLDAIPEPLLGDVNGDGQVNGLDVDPFVAVLLNGSYQPEADMNEDQVVNGLDVDPFVAAVVGGVHQIPEPSTLLLSIIALGVIGGWRKWGV